MISAVFAYFACDTGNFWLGYLSCSTGKSCFPAGLVQTTGADAANVLLFFGESKDLILLM
jgi:hypothetical protein